VPPKVFSLKTSKGKAFNRLMSFPFSFVAAVLIQIEAKRDELFFYFAFLRVTPFIPSK
jgi:hypothetical protein